MNRLIVEGFDADQVIMLSNLELQSYLANTKDSSDIIQDNVRKTTETALIEKNNMMTSLSVDAASADTNLVNTAYHLSRSKDLVNLATDVNKIAEEQVSVASINQALTSRQNEINEWSNYSKLELLYFMQIIFISLSLIAIFAYLLSISYISSSLFWTLFSTVFVIDLLIIVFKTRFTMMNRDGRYWHKMRFANQPYKKSTSDCT